MPRRLLAPWFAPASALVVAVLDMPYGFYMFLRLGIFFSAGVMAFFEFAHWGAARVWCGAFLVLALLFNPLILIHFQRETWAPIDLGAAVFYIAHWIVVFNRKIG